jgi:hypothetical protein
MKQIPCLVVALLILALRKHLSLMGSPETLIYHQPAAIYKSHLSLLSIIIKYPQAWPSFETSTNDDFLIFVPTKCAVVVVVVMMMTTFVPTLKID